MEARERVQLLCVTRKKISEAIRGGTSFLIFSLNWFIILLSYLQVQFFDQVSNRKKIRIAIWYHRSRLLYENLAPKPLCQSYLTICNPPSQ